VRFQERACWQALYQQSASIFRAREAARERSICGSAGLNDSGAVFEQTAEALRYALLDAHRFHRHGLRIEARTFEHGCVRKPGCQYRDADTQRFELKVKRLAKAVYVRLRGSVIRHTGTPFFRTHCPREDQAAPPPLASFAPKWWEMFRCAIVLSRKVA